MRMPQRDRLGQMRNRLFVDADDHHVARLRPRPQRPQRPKLSIDNCAIRNAQCVGPYECRADDRQHDVAEDSGAQGQVGRHGLTVFRGQRSIDLHVQFRGGDMTERTIRQITEGQVPVTAASSISVTEAARLMREHKVGALMVVDDAALVGVFTERDALFRVVAEGRSGDSTALSEVRTRTPQTIAPDKPFFHALQAMHDGGFRHLPVVEEGGRLLGIVSVRDALGPELESFVYELLRQEQIGEVLA